MLTSEQKAALEEVLRMFYYNVVRKQASCWDKYEANEYRETRKAYLLLEDLLDAPLRFEGKLLVPR